MTIREIAETLDATWLCCEEEGGRVLRTAFASDMMSDVLACVTEDTLLLTGLVNGQCVRTCEMLDVPCVVFVRSKEPLADALALALPVLWPLPLCKLYFILYHPLPMLKTPYTMFEACARLYTAGLRPVELG